LTFFCSSIYLVYTGAWFGVLGNSLIFKFNSFVHRRGAMTLDYDDPDCAIRTERDLVQKLFDRQ